MSRRRARHHRWLGRDRKSNGAPAGFAPQDAGMRSVREFAVAMWLGTAEMRDGCTMLYNASVCFKWPLTRDSLEIS